MARRGVRARELEVEVVKVGASSLVTIVPSEGVDPDVAYLFPTDAFVRVRPPKGLSRAWVEEVAADLAKRSLALKIEWPKEDAAVAAEVETSSGGGPREVVLEMASKARGVDAEKLQEFCEEIMSEEKL